MVIVVPSNCGDAGEAVQLTHHPGSDHSPDFSPDGKQVVFSGGLTDEIVVMRSDGSRRRVIFQAAGDFVADNPDWQSLPRPKHR